LIEHLVDTFRSIQIAKEAPHGPLSGFLLDPPLFAFRLKTSQGDTEIRVGSAVPHSSSTYLSLDGKKVWIADGFAFRMLGEMSSFSVLRKKTWTQIHDDLIDEVEVFQKGKSILYAQREGAIWTDRVHRHLKSDLNQTLKGLTQSSAQGWIDAAEDASLIKKTFFANPQFEVKMNDRKGKEVWIKMSAHSSILYGMNSTRPESVFLLERSLLKNLESLPHSTSLTVNH